MPNLLQRAAVWLGERLQVAGGRTVTYRRGLHSVELTLTPHMHEEQVLGQDGIEQDVLSYAWTITASELIINGSVVVPQSGDVIEETLDSGEEIRWEVFPRGDKDQCYEWMDSSKLLIRVNVKPR